MLVRYNVASLKDSHRSPVAVRLRPVGRMHCRACSGCLIWRIGCWQHNRRSSNKRRAGLLTSKIFRFASEFRCYYIYTKLRSMRCTPSRHRLKLIIYMRTQRQYMLQYITDIRSLRGLRNGQAKRKANYNSLQLQ